MLGIQHIAKSSQYMHAKIIPDPILTPSTLNSPLCKFIVGGMWFLWSKTVQNGKNGKVHTSAKSVDFL